VFSKALAQVEQYTLPVIFSRRHFNGQISSGCGTCIVLNPDGWILTASHIALETALLAKHEPEIEEFEKQKKAIIENPQLHPNDKRKRLRALKVNELWVTHQAVMWGIHQSQIAQFHGNAFSDIAVGRLQPFDPSWIKSYPIFKNPAEPMLSGTSLCRLGFPFHQINATFDERTQKFHLADGVLPIPRFPNEGIHTRIALNVSPDGKQQAKFLETSSPGLKGQSGGPIFDCNGHIWAMQSKTQSLPLGFAPEVMEGTRKIVEHQFMHVGWGAHVEEIIKLFQQFGVKFELSGKSASGSSTPTTS